MSDEVWRQSPSSLPILDTSSSPPLPIVPFSLASLYHLLNSPAILYFKVAANLEEQASRQEDTGKWLLIESRNAKKCLKNNLVVHKTNNVGALLGSAVTSGRENLESKKDTNEEPAGEHGSEADSDDEETKKKGTKACSLFSLRFLSPLSLFISHLYLPSLYIYLFLSIWLCLSIHLSIHSSIHLFPNLCCF